MNPPWLILVIFAMLIFFPVLGNIRPDKGVFPALAAPVRRQLGCGAVGVCARCRGQAQSVDQTPDPPLIDQLEAIDVPRRWGEVIGDFGLSWALCTVRAGAYIRR